MMTLNGFKQNNSKKPTYFSQYSLNFSRILLFILKNLIFTKDNLIKNDDIKPGWLTMKCTKLCKRRIPTEINRRLIL